MNKCLLGWFLLLSHFSFAQPTLKWDATIGSSNWDELHKVLITSDQHYLLAGNIVGAGGNIQTPTFGLNDFYLAKTDLNGSKVWEKTYGGGQDDRLWSVKQLANGDFLLGGSSFSAKTGNKTTETYGGADYWLIRTNASGQTIWQNNYGGTGDDHLFDLAENADGTFLLVGYSNSPVSGNKTTDTLGGFDGWVLKVDANGNLLSQQAFGGDGFDNLYVITAAPDGGYLIGGATESNSSATVSKPKRGKTDYYIVKIDEDGLYEWDTRFGGTLEDQLYAIKPLANGGFLIAGGAESGYSQDKSSNNLGSYDYWLIKINNQGKLIWDVSYGGTALDVAYDVVEMPGGNIYLAGVSDSQAGVRKTSATIGSYDYWLAYLKPNGEKIWDKSYGGTAADALTQLILNPDYSITMAGHSASGVSGYKTQATQGFNDIWLARTDCQIDIDLPGSLTVCSGSDYILEPQINNCLNENCEFIWNGVQNSDQTIISAIEPGTVHLLSRDQNGCLDFDTLAYDISTDFAIELGADTILAPFQTLILSPTAQQAATLSSFSWSNGSVSPSILVSETDTYAVTVQNSDGCKSTDTIYVCFCAEEQVYIANVFQPDGDINNDIWYIQSAEGAVDQIKNLQVYDVWGTVVFQGQNLQANDKSNGWDGTYRGKDCRPGVYTYVAEMIYSSGNREVLYGTVTIVY